MKKRKVERYGAVDRTFEIKLEKPPVRLRFVKALVAVLLIAVVVGTVIFASNLIMGGQPEREKGVGQVDNSELNEELLRVVSKTESLDKSFVPELVDYEGYSVSVYADESLKELLKAAEEKGFSLDVESAYISYDNQNKLYKKMFDYNRNHYSLTEVRAQARTEAVVPQAGNSEAQTGLLVTFKTNGKFEGSRVSRWLKDNCVQYGFVLRYPEDKTDATSMDYNPKAYRYVGKDNAEMMRSLNKTLDEYVLYLNSR